jgi:hypothetical protein
MSVMVKEPQYTMPEGWVLEDFVEILSNREYAIAYMRLGWEDGNPKSFKDIARVYGVSPARVSNLYRSTIAKIQHYIQYGFVAKEEPVARKKAPALPPIFYEATLKLQIPLGVDPEDVITDINAAILCKLEEDDKKITNWEWTHKERKR